MKSHAKLNCALDCLMVTVVINARGPMSDTENEQLRRIKNEIHLCETGREKCLWEGGGLGCSIRDGFATHFILFNLMNAIKNKQFLNK